MYMDFQEGGVMQGGAKKRLSRKKHCATGNKMTEGSCMNKELIRKVAKIMNSLGKKKKKYEKIDLSKPCYEIHAQICENLEKVDDCQAEACLLFKENILQKMSPKERDEFIKSFQPAKDEDMVKGKIKKKKVKKNGKTVYKPHAEVDDEAWLSTFNIEDACERDMRANKKYHFFGAEPRDFADCKVSSLCKFNPETYRKRGKTQLGFVFNTDPHEEDGEHWISMYMDLAGHNLKNHPAIYYFDSYGEKPPKEVIVFAKRIQKQATTLGLKYKFVENVVRHQYSTSECGIYSMYIIIKLIQGRKFQNLTKNKIADASMTKLRKVYFNPI